MMPALKTTLPGRVRGSVFAMLYALTVSGHAEIVLQLADVDVVRGGRVILKGINWQVAHDQRWVVLGPNGSGKTTLCRLASLYVHPTRGTVDVLGQRLGQTDVRQLRTRLGFTSAALTGVLRDNLRTTDVVVTGKHAALAPYWHRYTQPDYDKALSLLERFGCDRLAHAPFGTLSSGERQRVLLARTMMSDPSLLLLDEPMAGLDLGGREALVRLLAELAGNRSAPAVVLVTHHVDEIPPGFTHTLLLREGQSLAVGRIEETLTSQTLTDCFGTYLHLERQNGRWSARGMPG